ncbi:MAG TPA: hypothetical protein VHL58_02245 [Thermoanaerobaculia bacterium]|nr:hypothetical protein [Thermoanaerobaculia bacterium]
MPYRKKSSRLPADYARNVFINCPFDEEYKPIFEAIIFTVMVCGFRPLSARQRLDSSEIRLHKIIDLIASSRLAIHDLSRAEPTTLPRFNMPFGAGDRHRLQGVQLTAPPKDSPGLRKEKIPLSEVHL